MDGYEEMVEGYEATLRFLDMMNGEWGWIPVAIGLLVTAIIFDFVEKMKQR